MFIKYNIYMIVRFCLKIKRRMLLMISLKKLFRASEILFAEIRRKTDFYINRLLFKIKAPTYALELTVTHFKIKEHSFFKINNRGLLYLQYSAA